MIVITNNNALFISNAISDNEMSFEIKYTLSIISGSNLENLKHFELKPNLPVCSRKIAYSVSEEKSIRLSHKYQCCRCRY